MKKKNGFNIMLFAFIFHLFFILSCTRASKSTPAGSLLEADKRFSEMSVDEGMHKAFLSFIADDGVILRDNSYPSKGRQALAERFAAGSDSSFVLSWEPLYEKISSSGELGYTYGIYSMLLKSTGKVEKGTYVTIWLRQDDGSWKFVLDTGTDGLPDLNNTSGPPVSGQ